MKVAVMNPVFRTDGDRDVGRWRGRRGGAELVCPRLGGGGVTLRLAELSTAAAPSWRAAAKEREREARSRGEEGE